VEGVGEAREVGGAEGDLRNPENREACFSRTVAVAVAVAYNLCLRDLCRLERLLEFRKRW